MLPLVNLIPATHICCISLYYEIVFRKCHIFENIVSGMQVFHDQKQGDGEDLGRPHDSATVAEILLPSILHLFWCVIFYISYFWSNKFHECMSLICYCCACFGNRFILKLPRITLERYFLKLFLEFAVTYQLYMDYSPQQYWVFHCYEVRTCWQYNHRLTFILALWFHLVELFLLQNVTFISVHTGKLFRDLITRNMNVYQKWVF